MKKKQYKTLCVILHYGSEKYTNECIASINGVKNLDIVIVDNDPNQSYKPLKKFRKFVKIIKSGGLLGFASANNLGVKKSLKKYHNSILIINNDTVVTKGSIEYLKETLAIKNVGMAGPCMPYVKNIRKIWACGGFINKIRLTIIGTKNFDNITPYEVDYLPGAAFLIKSSLWKSIGGFNNEYFLAYEEAELALEVKKKGFKIIADPRSIIFHHVGMSSENTPKYYYNAVRNRMIFSKYLYGKILGYIYGIIVTFLFNFKVDQLSKIIQRIKLWNLAVLDNLKKIPIDRKVLKKIEIQFSQK